MQDASSVDEVVKRVHRAMERVEEMVAGGNRNTTSVKIEGSGAMWGGLAVGVALGAAIACTAWVAATMGDMRDDQRQDDAFIQAAYQFAPKLREEMDRIKQEQEKQP